MPDPDKKLLPTPDPDPTLDNADPQDYIVVICGECGTYLVQGSLSYEAHLLVLPVAHVEGDHRHPDVLGGLLVNITRKEGDKLTIIFRTLIRIK
jgi:hypothetical protein